MPVKTKAQLQAEAAQIANETGKRLNTAPRVGNALLDVVDSMSNMLDVTSYGAATTGTGAANDTAIAAAITAAIAASSDLWWPAGTYPSTASIANLHSVRHRGPGAILRGADTFYLQPKSSQTNRVYLSSTGSATNDGLSSSEPMATPQNAFDALKNYGPVLEGTWRVVNAAGTWAGTVHRHSHTTPSKNPVIFEGPNVGGHPNVPTAIYDGTVGAVASDWSVRATGYGVQIDVQSVNFQNYIGGTDSCGLLVDYGASLYFTNLHGSGSSYSDVYCQGCTTIRGGGGIWASPRGALINGCIDVTLGYGAIPVRFSGNTNCGVEWSRGSEGHVDFSEFNDCAIGVDVMHNSRVHLQSNNFKRATNAAIRARSGGYYYDDSNTFNDGTADENSKNFLNYAFSGETDGDLWTSQSERRVFVNKNTITHTGTNATTVVATGYSVPANWFEDATKRLRVSVFGEFTTPAPSRVGIQFGGTTIDQSSATGISATGTQFRYQCDVVAVAKDSQLKSAVLEYNGGGSSPQIGLNSPTADTDAAQIVGVTLKLNSSGDVAKIYLIEIWRTG